MRHRKHHHLLGRRKEHRLATLAALASALFMKGRIETTLAKAKALRPFAEKIITLAKNAQGAEPPRVLHLRRQAIAKIRDKEAVAALFKDRVDEFAKRPGGYTRIYKIGPRLGDAAEMAIIALIPASDEGYGRRSKRAATAPAAEPAPAAPAEGLAGPPPA